VSMYFPEEEQAFRDGVEKGKMSVGGLTITQMVEKCYSNAVKLGWAEKEVPVPEMCALIHSEVSEALEAYRNHEPLSWTRRMDGKPSSDSEINVLDPTMMKPEGIASEFADVLIRIGHYSKLLGINLEYEVLRKLEYNLTRGHRHGGKAI
jgi:NTP pyrophosphatase (non-canonical NTP hydrolase)